MDNRRVHGLFHGHGLEFPRHLSWKGRPNKTSGTGTKVESRYDNGRQPQRSQLKTDLEF
jgi:hypothetical protein